MYTVEIADSRNDDSWDDDETYNTLEEALAAASRARVAYTMARVIRVVTDWE